MGFKHLLTPESFNEEMLVGRQTGQWICRICRKGISNSIFHKRSFQATRLRWQGIEGVPPGLILRARKLALQHQELEEQATKITEYTSQSVQLYKRISELAEVTANLKEFEDTQKVISSKLLAYCRTSKS
jgi:hypothetical protein